MGEVFYRETIFVSKASDDGSGPPVFQVGRMFFDQPIKNISGGRLCKVPGDVVMGQACGGTGRGKKLANLEGIFSWKK